MLEELKNQVIRVARQAQHDGLCRHKSGNFSMRDPKTNYFVITPSGIDRDLLETDDIVVCDLDSNVIEYKEGRRPSSEVMMHITIYRTRPDVNAICHTHSKFATTFAVLNKPVPAVVYECMVLNLGTGVIPVAPYGQPGTRALSDSVIEPVKISDAFLLERHGAVAVDETDIDGAYLKANYIEEFSEVYFYALTANGGKEPKAFSADELKAWSYPSEIRFPQK